MIEKIQIMAYRCVCERPECPSKGTPWIYPYAEPPTICRYCRSREWNGKKVPVKHERPKVPVIPKPVRVRAADREEEEF